jgi:hypothetical protein
MTREGRPSGMCYVALTSENAFNIAMSKQGKTMGSRYVECTCSYFVASYLFFVVFESTMDEMERVLNMASESNVTGRLAKDGVIKLRGLPYSATDKDIRQFLSGTCGLFLSP